MVEKARLMRGRAVSEEDDRARTFLYAGAQPPVGVGHFRFLFHTDEWEWSSDLSALHGYPAEPRRVTTETVLAHKHPDDRAEVTRAVRKSANSGAPFRSRHRIVDAAGRIRHVSVIGDSLRDDDANVIGTDGLYVDLDDIREVALDTEFEARVTDFELSRTVIEQAKGMVMFAYSLTDQQAFDLLAFRSQQMNIKVRDLAATIVRRVPREIDLVEYNSARFDHILLHPHRPHPVDAPAPAAAEPPAR